MDAIVHSAVEEICSQGTTGLTLPTLWPKLRPTLAANGLRLCPVVKATLWTNILDVPGLLFQAQGVSYSLERDLSTLNSVEICEQMNLMIVAPEQLRNNFVGIYDVEASASSISAVQRRTLERLAIAGTNGIAQNQLAKEFGIKGNNFFYIMKKLESRGLIVRQSTLLRTKESTSVVMTNMLYLYRYAKHLGCQKRLEITKEDMPFAEDDIADESSGFNGESKKDDVHVKDFLPAYKAICDKLEEAEGKVLVVSDIKIDLNYRGTKGHRDWRNICNRLKEAQIVEEFCAKVKKKEVSCLRLLKKLSLEHFEAKSGNENPDAGDQFIKVGKRGQLTEQLVELPIEQQIYDMIDSAGSKGITITEVLRRLGLKNKQYYDRLLQFFSRCGMPLRAESHNKGVAYRVWTSNNFNSVKTDMVLHNSESLLAKNKEVKDPSDAVDMEVAQELADEVTEGVDASTSKDNAMVVYGVGDEPEGSHGSTTRSDQCNNNMVSVDDNSPNGDPEPSSRPCGLDVGTASATRSDVTSLEVSPSGVTPRSRRRRSYQVYPCLNLSPAIAQREQRILKMLEEEKFLLKAEILRRLEDLEKEKHTETDRKTLERCLNKLQKEGRCKCIAFQVPVLTNLDSTKRTAVVLHPSTFDESPEILCEKILERIRSFDILVRRECNSGLKKKGQEVPVLDDIQRIPSCLKRDSQAAQAEARRANGYVGARMVRTKLLHIFLWRYINEGEGISFGDIESDLENPHSTWRLFELNAAVKAMPLELYLQIIGSMEKSDNLIEKCQKGLRLSDLPLQEYRYLMDTRTMGRLSRLIDILRRLQLIRFANTRHRDDTDKVDKTTTLTHALELKPYIEEPVSVVSYSGLTIEDLRPHLRHDFVLSTIKTVEEYWSTLEYCYADSDSEAALHAFPGSAVPEVFRFRAWCSLRAISAYQRAELLRRVVVDDSSHKIPFKECEEIAKDLDLSLEQVLRVYHNKRHRRMTKLLGDSNATGEEIQVTASGKRKTRYGQRSDPQFNEETFPKLSKKKGSSFLTSSLINECDLHQEHLDDDQMESSPQEQDASKDENIPDMHQADGREKSFSWTEAADRQLVIEYVRYRAALGPRFNRTNWASLPNLPAPPGYCRRRMALLNKSSLFRKAVMRLCNLLAERYKRHFEIEGRWDDFNENDVKIALGDALGCKRLAKLDSSTTTKVVSDEESSSDPEMDLSAPPSCSGRRKRRRSRRKLSAQRSSFQHFPTQYRKILSSKITGLGSKVFESIAVSNAVELFKLIFLSTSSSPQASSSMLAETLRRYSQHDLFAAFSYLREKIAIIGGTGSKPFALSQHFLQSVYLSPFPINTGKSASNFASWLEEREKELMEEEIDLPAELQCGDIFHICALVSSGEVSMIPCLPEEGVGEVDSSKASKAPKRKNDSTELCDGDNKSKRARTLSVACESEISRREKGFPNIRLLLNRVTIPRIHSLDTFKDKNSTSNLVHGEEEEDQDNARNIAGIDIDVQNKSPWDAMSRYAERLFSASFDPELFESICLAIHKSGDQGLCMKEISKLLDVTGQKEKEAEIIVEVLETFGQTLKVPAYDSVSFVAPLYRTKYFLTPVAGTDETCLHRERIIDDEVCPVSTASREDGGISSLNNDKVHRVTILNHPKEAVVVDSLSETLGNQKVEGEATGLHSSESRTYSSHILPWINGDGTRNELVYKGLTRRLLGIVMQNPGIMEDNIILKMNALNPQSCRELLKMMILDNHVIVRRMHQRESAKPPFILSGLLKSPMEKPKLVYRDHFLANPMSTTLL